MSRVALLRCRVAEARGGGLLPTGSCRAAQSNGRGYRATGATPGALAGYTETVYLVNWDDRLAGAVAKSVVPVRQRFVSISYNVLIYRGIIGNLRGLLFGNNVARVASRG